MFQDGRSSHGKIKEIEARIYYRENTKAPLGDFPDLTPDWFGMCISEKALNVFWDKIHIFFEKVPIRFTGGGVEMKSGILYAKEINELPEIPDKENQYYYLHPCASLLASNNEPKELPEFIPREPSEINIYPEELERKLEKIRENYKGLLYAIEEDIGDYHTGPIFVARDSANIYFNDEFIKICKKEKLLKPKLSAVDNSDATYNK